MEEKTVDLKQENQNLDRNDVYSSLKGEVRQYSERVAHNVQILFSKVVEKGLYSSNSDINLKDAPLVFDAVKYFDIGVYFDDETSGNIIPTQHVHKGSEIIFSDVKTLEEFQCLSKEEKYIRNQAKNVAYYHHERWDGEGYPDGVKMEEIPLLARLCSICLQFDKLTCKSNKPLPLEKQRAAHKIKLESGKAFDPLLVDVLCEYVSELAVEGDVLICYEDRMAEEKRRKEIAQKIENVKNDYKKSGDKIRSVELLYQPVVDLKTNRNVYYDTTMIINDRYHGTVKPVVFMFMAERTGQICELTEITLEQALDFIVLADEKKMNLDRVIIRISGVHLARKTFFSKIERIISKSAVTPDRLIFEISEGTIATANQKIFDTIAKLREFGIKIAIDNFGAEYSSLHLLNKLEFDIFKIDKSFISDVTDSQRVKGIVKGLLDMAEGMGVEIICEGVDLPEQKLLLAEMGCSKMQGDLFKSAKTLKQIIG